MKAEHGSHCLHRMLIQKGACWGKETIGEDNDSQEMKFIQRTVIFPAHRDVAQWLWLILISVMFCVWHNQCWRSPDWGPPARSMTDGSLWERKMGRSTNLCWNRPSTSFIISIKLWSLFLRCIFNNTFVSLTKKLKYTVSRTKKPKYTYFC